MAHTANVPDTTDICLLLRAHAEQSWLLTRVLPLVRALERPDAIEPEEQGSALAYLEVLWLEAGLRAAATVAAAEALAADAAQRGTVIAGKARRYEAAIRRMRGNVDGRVRRLTRPAEGVAAQEASGS